MTDLVAGGSGLVGSALLDLLLAPQSEREVIALVRRPLPREHPRLRVQVMDFAQAGEAASTGTSESTPTLPGLPLPPLQRVFIALGTTIRAAGSQAAFRTVDHDHVVAVARIAQAAGARRLAVVSALGADPSSRVFYNRVKGEMERSVAALGFESVLIVRPSLLDGERAASRPAERAAILAAQLLRPLLPPRWRVIDASAVAKVMVGMIDCVGAGLTVIESDALQRYTP